MVDTMRRPELILDILKEKATNKDYVFEGLYKHLYNPDFFLKAYSKIYAKEGNMTEGTDGKTIDGFNLNLIEKLIESLRNETYQPQPARRVYIPKKNGKKRPLGIPSFNDKLVQEVVRQILESIYEQRFLDTSHGFRPQRSCHTALFSLKARCSGLKWWIEGDIKGFYDNIDHQTLIALLRKTIKDERFINLIWKFLKAGYLEDWVYNNTYSGTPQGGIVSPILANIYLHELDCFMDDLQKRFNRGKRRRNNPEYHRLNSNIWNRKKKLRNKILSEDERNQIELEIKEMSKTREKLSSEDPMDENFKRLQYVRYADDFVVAVIGSKEDAELIRTEIANFISKTLKLELSMEKTLITHANSKRIAFLGYEVSVGNNDKKIKSSKGIIRRSLKGIPILHLPHEKMRDYLLKKKYMVEKDGKWKAIHRTDLIHNDPLEIIATYNAEIRGLYEYYKLATDVSKLNGAYGIMKTSCAKTLASKYKTSCSKIYRKFSVNGVFGVSYETKKGRKFCPFYNEGFVTVKTPTLKDIRIHKGDIDTKPNEMVYKAHTSLEQRLLANKCEYCGSIEKCEVHHVRKLKDLKGKEKWEVLMIARRRKTLVLCRKCHDKLHAGKLD
jgi:group II intron reverse transcriptase/maturase